MKILVIINSLINLIVIWTWLRNNNKFYVEIDRTFWKKKAYSISFWKVVSGSRKEGGYEAHCFFHIPLLGGKKALLKD